MSVFILVLLLSSVECRAEASMGIETVDVPPSQGAGSHYTSNRPPLTPSPLVKLPIGNIKPKGWLLGQLELMRDGFVGHLPEVSKYCRADSGWLHQKKKAWEEVPYWLKGFGDLGYVLNDERSIKETRVWIDALIAGQGADGWIGPRPLKDSGDAWPNMIMLYVLRSFHEATGDGRVLDTMTRYFRYRNSLSDEDLYRAEWGVGTYVLQWWQHVRAGDELDSVYWLYNRTGDAWLLDFARRVATNGADWSKKVQSWHGVNICQGFRNPALYYQQTGNGKWIEATRRRLDDVYGVYGQVPGGMFGADEDCRPGYHGPRQGAETCSMTEIMHSFEMLLKITGDPDFADKLEDVAFNSLPASTTPDLKALHYVTSPNVVRLDHTGKAPGLENGGNTLAYDPWDHRCCQHNVAMGWPYYAEHLWMATQDRGLAAVLYAASEVKAKVGDGVEVTFRETTDYPFDETVTLELTTPRPVEFPLYLRIPGWCDGAETSVNGRKLGYQSRSEGYAVIERAWVDGDEVRLRLPMRIRLTTWERNGNSVSVSRGPLTYSLRIGERWEILKEGPGEDYDKWPAYKVYPTTPWNYGLVLDETDPAASFAVRAKTGPLSRQPFTVEDAPIELAAKGKRIEAWQQDPTGLVGEVQQNPARVDDSPPEDITLIPMGCARLRISAFPVAGSGPEAHEWSPPPACIHEASHVDDEITAVSNGLWPWRGVNPTRLPRFTWRPRQDTTEWITFKLGGQRTVSETHVYWVDDGAGGECRPPASWRVLWKSGELWKPVVARGKAGADRRGWDSLAFDPIETAELKLEVKLRDDCSAGVFEWIIGAQNPS
jgi:hypothetical protein